MNELVHVALPRALDLRDPAVLERLVEVHADADVAVVGDEGERGVARDVEAPGGEGLLVHDGAELAELGDGGVGAAGVEDDDDVGAAGPAHEGGDEGFFVLGDGVDAELQRRGAS